MNSHDALKIGLVGGDLAAKSCIVLLIAWAATRCLRHQSASSRHLVWLAGFGILLLLPVFTLVVPGKQFPVIRESANSQSTTVQSPTEEMSGRLIDPINNDPVELSSLQLKSDALTLPVIAEPAAVANRGWSGPNLMECLMGLWLVGFAVVAARSIRGVLAVRRFRRQSSQPFPNRIGFTFASVARQVGVTRPWDLRLSTSRIPPAAMTWGIFHPVVLMPKDSDSWTQERLEAVLLHELAHVRRFDSVSQLIALAASALYWFNPLVWLCARAMRAEAESAADDTVIRMGIRPSDYASELLRIAAELGQRRQPFSPIGVSVMKQSKIESRVKAILDPSARRRRGVTVLESIATIAVAGIAMLPLGALRAGVFQQEPPKPPTLVAPNQVAPPAVLAIPPIPVAPPAKLSPPCPRQVAPPARVASVAPVQSHAKPKGIQQAKANPVLLRHANATTEVFDMLASVGQLDLVEAKLKQDQAQASKVQAEKSRDQKANAEKAFAEAIAQNGLKSANPQVEVADGVADSQRINAILAEAFRKRDEAVSQDVLRQVLAQQKVQAEQRQQALSGLRDAKSQRQNRELVERIDELFSQKTTQNSGKLSPETRKRIDEAIRQMQGQSQLMHAQIEEARAQLNRTQKEVERQRELIRRLQNIQLRLTESKRHANGKESLNALAYLQTELTVARAKLAQLEHLHRKGIISKDKVGQAEAELRKASDAYRQAEQALKMPLKTKG